MRLSFGEFCWSCWEKKVLISVGVAERLGCTPGAAGSHLVVMKKEDEAGREENKTS